MSRLVFKAAVALAGASIFAIPASAQAPSAAAAPQAVDPAAVSAVNRMSAYLRTLQKFGITANSTRETVLDDGLKVQLAGTTQFQISRPTGFYADVRTDRVHREFFFDGSKLTMFAPRMQSYTSIDAPGNIRQMLETAYDRYGIDLPLADLFYWGGSAEDVLNPSSALVVGFARIDGVESDHYALREGDIAYQIWIQRGDKPLPLKLVYTDVNDPDRPQYAATLKWDLNPVIASDRFTFKPPKDAIKITAVKIDSDGDVVQ